MYRLMVSASINVYLASGNSDADFGVGKSIELEFGFDIVLDIDFNRSIAGSFG